MAREEKLALLRQQSKIQNLFNDTDHDITAVKSDSGNSDDRSDRTSPEKRSERSGTMKGTSSDIAGKSHTTATRASSATNKSDITDDHLAIL